MNLAVELVGDAWSLLVLRDVLFADRHTFGELHAGSLEGIATNVLTDRLRKLVDAGLLTRGPVPGHRQKVSYRATERALDLVPVLVALARFSLEHLDPDPELTTWLNDLAGAEPRAELAALDGIRHANGLAPAARPEGTSPV